MDQKIIAEAQELQKQFPEILDAWATGSDVLKKAIAITISEIAEGGVTA